MIKIGEVNTLTVASENISGFLLDHVDEDEHIFLPGALAPRELSIGDKVDVFISVDNSGSLIATTEIPNTLVGEFGFLKVVDVLDFGAFLDWGASKDLFIPDTEQRENIYFDESHLVRVCIDPKTEKIYGTTKVNKYIQSTEFDIDVGEKVQITPVSDEDLGYKCIINKKYIGMIYHNEIFQDIYIGSTLEGQVKKIREDGLVDAALQVQGFKNVLNSKETILEYLVNLGGKSPLHDKSHPEEIRTALNMSKKTFKSSIGMLYRDKLIIIKKDGIELVEK